MAQHHEMDKPPDICMFQSNLDPIVRITNSEVGWPVFVWDSGGWRRVMVGTPANQYTNTQIHKYTNTQSEANPNITDGETSRLV